MRNAGWRTTAFFLLARLVGKAELTVWGLVAWLAEQRDRRGDKKIAERLAKDPARFGRRPYEHNVTQDPKW